MGIRINKRLGFGLTDVQLDEDGCINDPRISSDALDNLYSNKVESYYEYLVEKFGEPWSKTKKALDGGKLPSFSSFKTDLLFMGIHKDEKERQKAFSQTASKFVLALDNTEYQFEGHDDPKGILLLQPYMSADLWTHHDNGIDYAESQQKAVDAEDSNPMAVEVLHLDYAQYPYNGIYVDSRTMESVNAQYWHIARDTYSRKAENPEEAQKAADLIAQHLGYADYAEAHNFIAPEIPPEMVHLAEWLNLFHDISDIHTLRPMIVTYWQ